MPKIIENERNNKYMTKNEMIKAVSERVDGATNKLVDEVLKAYADVMLETINNDKTEKVSLPNIGTFSAKEVPERTGKVMMGANVGSTWTKSAHTELCFKITKSVKEI